MSSGKLGSADLAATTNTTVYHPTVLTGAVSVSICNRNASSVTVNLAVSATSSPGNDEWIEYGSTIIGNNVLERTGLVVGVGQYVVAWASGTGVSASAYGYED